jgi:hypothetical protein
MGNSVSMHNQVDECIICWDNIETINKVTCTRCNISLHTYCEETDRNVRTRYHCKCPHCQGIGTLCTWS